MNKKQMRALALEARAGLTKSQRADFSGVITEKLMKLPCYQNAKALLTYVSFRSEVDTVSLIRLALQEGKAVFAPKVLGRDMAFFRISSLDDLSPGYRGIWEPEAKTSYNDWISQNPVEATNPEENGIPEENLPHTLLCMPGAAFDRQRHRIGYGGGFYDRYLWAMGSEQAKRTVTAALAFSCQVFQEIPWEAHDICPDGIITETDIMGTALHCMETV